MVPRARQKEGSPKDEVGSKRFRQQPKQAKALKPGPSPTGDMSDTDDEGDSPERNFKATYAKAKFATIHSDRF